MKALLKDVVVPVITPLTDDQRIDIKSMIKISARCLERGANALFAFGTAGEGYALNIEDKTEAVPSLTKNFPGKMIFGLLEPATNIQVNFIRKAAKAGADFFAAVPPYYMDDITQENIVEHYSIVGKYAKYFVIYNIPGTTGINILPETVLKIKNMCPNCIGIKNSGSDLSQLKELIELTKDDNFSVMQGNCDYAIEGLSLGADGIIPVLANIMPELYRDMCLAAAKGEDTESLKTLCKKLSQLEQYPPNWISSIKASMNVIGLNAGFPSLPYKSVSDEGMAWIKTYIRKNLNSLW
jgi:4-hydroxy-tetrahydrodipicolinate synthase